MRSLALLILGATLLATPHALADVAAPMPESCPGGGIPATDHYGGYCSAWSCTANSDCWSGQACQAAALCVSDQLFEHWRGNTTRAQVAGSCVGGKACPEGSECRTGRFCADPGKLPPPRPQPASTKDGDDEVSKPGRCALVGPAGPGLLTLALIALGLRRRRASA